MVAQRVGKQGTGIKHRGNVRVCVPRRHGGQGRALSEPVSHSDPRLSQ